MFDVIVRYVYSLENAVSIQIQNEASQLIMTQSDYFQFFIVYERIKFQDVDFIVVQVDFGEVVQMHEEHVPNSNQ